MRDLAKKLVEIEAKATKEDLRHMRAVVRNFDHCCLERADHYKLLDIADTLRNALPDILQALKDWTVLQDENGRLYKELNALRSDRARLIEALRDTLAQLPRGEYAETEGYVQTTALPAELDGKRC